MTSEDKKNEKINEVIGEVDDSAMEDVSGGQDLIIQPPRAGKTGKVARAQGKCGTSKGGMTKKGM